MAYISAEEVKSIRNAVKKAFPAFKFSVTRDHSSGVIVRLTAGPLEFSEKRFEVNTHYIAEHYRDRPEMLKLFQGILEIMHSIKKPHYYETGDYGTQPDYYGYIQVGSWDKAYIFNGEPEKLMATRPEHTRPGMAALVETEGSAGFEGDSFV